jgi:hypothetical protein
LNRLVVGTRSSMGYSDITRAPSAHNPLKLCVCAQVLLKNMQHTLPLDKSAKVLLAGPHATTQQDLGGNYFEDICPSGGSCVPSMQFALGNVSGAAPIVNAGCHDTACTDHSQFSDVVAAAKSVDCVIVALGLVGRPKIFSSSTTLDGSLGNNDGTEGEGHDRSAITLPDGQMALVEAILGAVRPSTRVVVVLFNGGGLAIEKLFTDPRVHAIVEGFFPGVAGAKGLAKSIYGLSNRFSKMPYTLLAEAFTAESTFKDMSMTNPPGRGYRYYKGKNVIVPYGFGLSFTSFTLQFGAKLGGAAIAAKLTTPELDALSKVSMPLHKLRGTSHVLATVYCNVTNTGPVRGDEVIFLFHNASAAAARWVARRGSDGPDPLAIKQVGSID